MTVLLICALVVAYAKSMFSHDATYFFVVDVATFLSFCAGTESVLHLTVIENYTPFLFA